jgi:hypothetical protein
VATFVAATFDVAAFAAVAFSAVLFSAVLFSAVLFSAVVFDEVVFDEVVFGAAPFEAVACAADVVAAGLAAGFAALGFAAPVFGSAVLRAVARGAAGLREGAFGWVAGIVESVVAGSAPADAAVAPGSTISGPWGSEFGGTEVTPLTYQVPSGNVGSGPVAVPRNACDEARRMLTNRTRVPQPPSPPWGGRLGCRRHNGVSLRELLDERTANSTVGER